MAAWVGAEQPCWGPQPDQALGALLTARNGEKGEGQRQKGEGGRERRGRGAPVLAPELWALLRAGPHTLTLSPGCEPAACWHSWEGARGWVRSPQPPHGQLRARSCRHSTPGLRHPHIPSSTAVTWQVDVYRRVGLRLCQAPVLSAAAVLQHIFDRGRAASCNQPTALPISVGSITGYPPCEEGGLALLWSHRPSSWCFTGRLISQNAARISPGPQRCPWDEQS